MKPFILILFSFFCLNSFAQHYVQRYDGKIAKGNIVNIKNGSILFVDTSIKDERGFIDTLFFSMLNISKFGMNPDYQNINSKKYLTKTDLYNLTFTDAVLLERKSQKYFTATGILVSFSIAGFVSASLFDEPIMPNKSNYYFTNKTGTYYDGNKYLSDSSNYLNDIDAYHNKVNVTRIISGVLGIASIICATTGVNNLLKAKRNKYLAEKISFMFSPTNLYIGYKF